MAIIIARMMKIVLYIFAYSLKDVSSDILWEEAKVALLAMSAHDFCSRCPPRAITWFYLGILNHCEVVDRVARCEPILHVSSGIRLLASRARAKKRSYHLV